MKCVITLMIGILCLSITPNANGQIVLPPAPSAEKTIENDNAKPIAQPATKSPTSQPVESKQNEVSPKATVTSKPTDGKPTTAPKGPEKISAAFKNMTVEQVGAFLSEKKSKPVLVSDAVKSKKITIINKQKLTLPEAIYLIRQALLAQGAVVEEQPALIRIRPISDVMQFRLRQIPANVSITTVKDTLEIVTKTFRVRHYDVGNLTNALTPMLPSYGRIMADPNNRTLVVTDTVGNLIRMEQIITNLDVPLAEGSITEIIKVKNGDVSEIIAIVRWLIAGRMGISAEAINVVTGPVAKPSQPGRPRPPSGMSPRMAQRMMQAQARNKKSGGKPGETGVTQIEQSKAPVTLVPHVSRNWIIAVAPADLMIQIKEWVKQLDIKRETQEDYELYEVVHASVTDVASQIQQTLQSLPTVALRETTHVVPFDQANKLIVFGSPTGRKLVRDLLKKLDVEGAEQRIMKTFLLEHADAEDMAERIETLFSSLTISYQSRYSTSYRYDPRAERISAVADKRRNAITVICNAKTMKKIEDMLKEEDVAIDPEMVRPRVYHLKYINPGEMKDLLSSMFSEKTSGQRFPSWFWGGRDESEEAKPIGRLLGQFTFQILPSADKLIVNTKNSANFIVIDQLIELLDQPQRAGIPEIVELKYANAEDLCEQLNAILAEPGTLARIRRAERGLTTSIKRSSLTDRDNNARPNNPQANANQNNQASASEMQFWWQQFRPSADDIPNSNLVGKIRIVPVYQRNALMILSSEGYKEPLVELIEELDQRSRQVMIKARIGEIQHEDQTTLGLRIASDPSLLNPADTAIRGTGTTDFTKVGIDLFGGVLTLKTQANVSALLDLLIRNFNMKILMAPTITTSDNQASEYFDGQDVPVMTKSVTSEEGGRTVIDIVYEEVGTRLRVRPHITKNGSVDLRINLSISRIVPGQSALGNFIFDRREVTTHVVIKSGETIMLSGIVRQQEFEEIRKVPLLGDLPWIGKFFRHINKSIRNSEMIIFVTPQVVNTPEELQEQMKEPIDTFRRIEGAVNGDPETWSSSNIYPVESEDVESSAKEPAPFITSPETN